MRGFVRGLEQALALWRARSPDGHVLLLLDFDGTLAEFHVDPSAVRLSDSRRALLQSIAARPGFTLAIVTGRRIADVRERSGAGPTVFYAGLHGLEIDGPGLRFTHQAVSLAAPTIGVFQQELREAVCGLPGVFIEDKGFSAVLHVRGASKSDRWHATARFHALAEPYVRAGVLRLLRGDEIIEALPNIDWTKGDAVRCIVRHVDAQMHQPVWPIYIGDDATDEDGFEAIGDGGLTISVSDRTVGAACRLPDPAAVERFLHAILATD
jgi:trehalose-phosphatase